ncbi:MAG: sugar phosphate isomerase/epimerase [Candidatus Bathyarchaeota archaeon]|nr:sugar phosphate isomerase/epimerase [Candidatus Bathyarchaeota archaeon]
MRIGLSMLFCSGKPFPHLLKQLETVDVVNIELLDEGLHALNRRRVRAIRKLAEEKGLQLSVHAPFADINIASTTAVVRRAVLNRLKKSIMLSRQLGSSLWVFHPGLRSGMSHLFPELSWQLNLQSVRELLVAAEQCGIEITIENGLATLPFLLTTAEDFVRFYEDLGETEMGLTLDVGHANINDQIYGFLKIFPSRIVNVHLHDNHGGFDEHLGIGDGNIDWSKLVKTFKKIDYKGTLIVEAEKNAEESLETLRTLVHNV